MSDENPITIVSGLPRSGTSLMMQMLKAGDMRILADERRQADEDNPRGYFELQKVKQTATDASWLDQAAGTVVKVVSMLLYDLPMDRPYRVIFMERDAAEILASQAAMLKRKGRVEGPDPEAMKTHFERHLNKVKRWMAEQDNIETLCVTYGDLVKRPEQEARRIIAFLGKTMDAEHMAAVVDPALYRQRAGL